MSARPLVRFAAGDVAATAHYYPHSFDAAGDRVMLIRLSEADYNAASFLDQRVLTPAMRGTWIPFAEVAAMAHLIQKKPLNFIFHTGHVGSTLLSRLFDQAPGVLGLREPVPLRVLADMLESGMPRKAFAERLDALLALLSRGFARTKAVIIKPTSFVGRIAPQLLAAAPEARAVYLNLRPESAITALLAASGGDDDLRLFAAMRGKRLEKLLGEPFEQPSSTGELAAIAWLVERAAQLAVKKNARALLLDFETLLADLEQGLSRIAVHFGMPAESGAALAASPVLNQYSKAPTRLGFSPADRVKMMARARLQHGAEVDKGLALLESLSRHKPVAKLLN